MPHPPRSPHDPDEILPPEPEDEPEDQEDELAPTLWEEDPREEPEAAERDEDPEPLPGEGALDDGWWTGQQAEDDGEEPDEEEPPGTPFEQEPEEPGDEADLLWAAPAALPRAGWRERVWLPEHGLELRAELDTGAELSGLVGALRGREGDRARVELLGRELVLEVEEQGGVLIVRLPVSLGPLDLLARARLLPEDGGAPLRLGREALAGRLLVDPGAEGLLGVRR